MHVDDPSDRTTVRGQGLPASTSHGTVENNGDIVTWTLPAGTVIPANSDVDVLWHFLSELGQPTSVTAVTSSPLISNQTSNSADEITPQPLCRRVIDRVHPRQWVVWFPHFLLLP